jgi:hypothetical protein
MGRGSRRFGASSRPSTQPAGIEPLGTVRRSQLISTYGIGAVIDLEKGSYMPMGLEDWEDATRLPSLSLQEARLQAQLGVSHFRLPPVAEQIPNTRLVNPRSVVPAARFPEYHECPKCHRIGVEGDPFQLAPDGSRLQCLGHGGNVYANPVRFAVACRAGHVSDFPWAWWAHQQREEGICDRPDLVLRSRGKSAALGDLYVACLNCKSSRSLAKAFQPGSLGKDSCRGFRPWLHDRVEGCTQRPEVIQRGASNFHFPVVASALSIPPVSEAAFQIVAEIWDVLTSVPAEAVEGVLGGQADKWGIDPGLLVAAWKEKRSIESGAFDLSEGAMRADEYAALSHERDDPVVGGIVPHFQNQLFEPSDYLTPWFDLVGAVHRLREVRALAAFSRIDPWPVSADRVGEALAEGKVAPLSRTPRNWLPAAEIRGEGIFLRFRGEAIDRWITDNPDLAQRAKQLDDRSAQVALERGFARDYSITPRLLLVHSFAHALIRQISIDCGYSSAAIRERLYISEATPDRDAMHGVLVYTGSPDSEGSLGGLVRLADPLLLEDVIRRTMASARWCGSDPVCLETQPGQAGDRISGAACHCCLLVPETACEKFNRELDRSVLVGSADGDYRGFFGEGNN